MATPQKIIRRPDRAEGGITDEERARLAEHAQMWVRRILRTEPVDPEAIGDAIRGLYRVSGLREPRVIVVPSPLVLAVAGGFAAAIWSHRGRATCAATYAATRAATDDATYAATYDATDDATYAATYAAAAAAADAADAASAAAYADDAAVPDAAVDFYAYSAASAHLRELAATIDALREGREL